MSKVRKVPPSCICGRPALKAGALVSGGGFLFGSACERCARIEESLHGAAMKRTGSNRLSDGLRIKRGADEDTFRDVARACDAWLRARNLPTEVSITVFDFIQ